MTLPAGSRLGPYEILGPLGAGGMGEVYRARDTRLQRDVAIKILPDSLAADPEALARFEREARAVAALSHPNILAIHDFGVEGGRAFSVTELLEGRTLRERLAEGPLPVRKAIECAAQVARGLAAAHDRGVVHRDLKPENLFVTDDGRVKILDFGLAKVEAAGEVGGDASNATQTPTRHLATRPGVVLGTIGYMSPEQVRGTAIDHRTDLFSLGAVLYEMLTGQRAFRGATAADTMTAILREDPPALSGIDRAVPPALERLVHHSLEKNPAERFQSARDLAFHLEAMGGAVSGAAIPSVERSDDAPKSQRGRGIVLTAAAALVAGAALGVALDRSLRGPATAAPPSLRQLTYTGADFAPDASRDGKLIVYTSEREGRQSIWLKQYPGGDEVALTSGPDELPRFSPDGTQILFIRLAGAKRDLYRVPVVGGEPRKVLDDVLFADWSPDGREIVFVRRRQEGDKSISAIGLVDANGDGAREIAREENQALVAPRWSPDGRTIALINRGAENTPGTILLVRPDGTGRRVLETPPPAGALTPAVWSGDGSALVYGKEEGFVSAGALGGSGRIIRQEIDSGRSEVILWSPMRPADVAILTPGRLILGGSTQRVNLLVSGLASGPAASGQGRAHRWITRGNASDRQPIFSPDGEWVMFSSNRSGNLELWKVSITTGAIRRLTDDPAQDWDPAFTPDGRGMVWSSSRTGHFEIWSGNADGTGARRLTDDGVDAENPTMTPDGAWVVYNSSNPDKTGIWKIRADGTQATRLVPGSWSTPDVSPDGQWVAFRTRAIPRVVRVARVSDGRLEPQVIGSNAGFNNNARPRWLTSGREILFNDTDEDGNGGIFAQAFVPGTDTARTRRLLAGLDTGQPIDSYAISPDGTHMVQAIADTLDSLLLAEGVPGIEPPGPAARR
ncbi:MAG TPA: protein kinase [Candidatus Polarisedimenticolia bacterium]|nr:protein kinase [Candidatus Polarisedimenticolia bacterium]